MPVARDAAVTALSLTFPLGAHTRVDASYLGQFASHASDQAARLSLTVTF